VFKLGTGISYKWHVLSWKVRVNSKSNLPPDCGITVTVCLYGLCCCLLPWDEWYDVIWCKARFPLPELTARVDGWTRPVISASGNVRPSTRPVLTGNGNRSPVNSGHQPGLTAVVVSGVSVCCVQTLSCAAHNCNVLVDDENVMYVFFSVCLK